MGNSLERLLGFDVEYEDSTHSVHDIIDTRPKVKRKSTSTEAEVCQKKIKKLDTVKYVYEKLFLKGEGSDITITACGRSWALHKLYLQQCKFFEVMLNGNWLESTSNQINLDVADENVTAEGMNSVLASLYHNEINIEMNKIQEVLSAAFFIGLESVITRCEEIMIESLSYQNALKFHDIAEKYGLVQVQTQAFLTLKHLFWKCMSDRNVINDLSESLLCRLLSSTDLIFVEGEIDLYKVVKKWIYFNENKRDLLQLDLPDDKLASNMVKFFHQSSEDLFLKYSSIFAKLKINHIIIQRENIKIVEDDKLIPRIVLDAIMVDQWKLLMNNEERYQQIEELDQETFELDSIRLGRIVDSFPKCWRWTGFKFGVDLLLHITNFALMLKRNCLNQVSNYSLSLRNDVTVFYRVLLVDDKGKVIFDSEKKSVQLRVDQSITVTRIPEDVCLPLTVNFQYLTMKPHERRTCEYINKYSELETCENVS